MSNSALARGREARRSTSSLPWSDYEHQRLARLVTENRSAAEIAATLGRTVPAIYNRLSRLRAEQRLERRRSERCTVPGCERRHHAMHMCKQHYAKWRQL